MLLSYSRLFPVFPVPSFPSLFPPPPFWLITAAAVMSRLGLPGNRLPVKQSQLPPVSALTAAHGARRPGRPAGAGRGPLCISVCAATGLTLCRRQETQSPGLGAPRIRPRCRGRPIPLHPTWSAPARPRRCGPPCPRRPRLWSRGRCAQAAATGPGRGSSGRRLRALQPGGPGRRATPRGTGTELPGPPRRGGARAARRGQRGRAATSHPPPGTAWFKAEGTTARAEPAGHRRRLGVPGGFQSAHRRGLNRLQSPLTPGRSGRRPPRPTLQCAAHGGVHVRPVPGARRRPPRPLPPGVGLGGPPLGVGRPARQPAGSPSQVLPRALRPTPISCCCAGFFL